tara:strand:- start:194 stop:931 length:738 start_codon:yes stop_codon:yes gene_type:complete
MDYELRVWEKPSPSFTYALGGDPAEGLSHGDDAVIEVICCDTGEQACELQGKIDPITFGEMAFVVGTWYNDALVGLENNKDGGANQTLFNLGYRNIYFQQTQTGKPFRDATQKLGWNTNLRTRPILVAQARRYIEDASVFIRSRSLLAQFETFALEGTKFQAIAGGHDDLVMAYLIAIEMMRVQLMVKEMSGNGLRPMVDGHEIKNPDELDNDEVPPITERLIHKVLSDKSNGQSVEDSTMGLLV